MPASNVYFDFNDGVLSRFVRFDTVRAVDLNTIFDAVTTGFDDVEAKFDANDTAIAARALLASIPTVYQAAIDLKADLASPALTGTPTAPNAAVGTNTTQLATMAALQTALANAGLTGAYLPDQSGKANYSLKTNGTVISWAQDAMQFVSAASASSSAAIEFTGIDDSSHVWVAHLINLVPATDGAVLWMRTTANSGSSYDSGVSDYDYATPTVGTTDEAQILLSNVVENTTADGGVSGVLLIFNPAGTTHNKRIQFNGSAFSSSSGEPVVISNVGVRNSTAAVDGFQIKFSTGAIASGMVKLYKMRKE